MENIKKVKKKLERALTLNIEINAEKGIKDCSESRLDELYKIKHEISDCIHKVENPIYRTLLIERYINLKKWEQIAVDMNYELSNVHKLHKKALEEIQKKNLLNSTMEKR